MSARETLIQDQAGTARAVPERQVVMKYDFFIELRLGASRAGHSREWFVKMVAKDLRANWSKSTASWRQS